MGCRGQEDGCFLGNHPSHQVDFRPVDVLGETSLGSLALDHLDRTSRLRSSRSRAGREVLGWTRKYADDAKGMKEGLTYPQQR